MLFPHPLQNARFVRREKRFLIHALGPDGAPIIAHTNNTGRMTGCLFPGGRIWLSPATDPARKLQWTLEIVETPAGQLVGVNTTLANRLVADALAEGLLPPLAGFGTPRREVRYGSRRSRVDLLLARNDERVWVEVKNVSLVSAGRGSFPDAPTVRGRKHLLELMEMVHNGDRAALVLCAQRADTRSIEPADTIDPAYGIMLRRAAQAGVEVSGLGCQVATTGIFPDKLLPIVLAPQDNKEAPV